MNNIERFKSGDKRLQVVVKDMSDEQKILVQKGFDKLGWKFHSGVGSLLGRENLTYTNCFKDSVEMDGNLYRSVCDIKESFPTTSFTELMILANMESLPDVIPYLNKDELKKYNIKQEIDMESNEFTKDMLKDGMFVLMRDQEDEHSKGYSIVLGKGFINEEGYVSIDYYDDDLLYRGDESFDVVEVFTSEKLTWWKEESFNKQLTSIWKRQSPEEEQRLSEKAALQEDIEAVKERLKSMESKLESM